MLRLIVNEQGKLENRWIPDEGAASSNIKVLCPALKDKEGKWEQVEWLELQPDDTVNVNRYTKERILAEQAAAKPAKPAKKAQEELASSSEQANSLKARLCCLKRDDLKSMGALQDAVWDLIKLTEEKGE